MPRGDAPWEKVLKEKAKQDRAKERQKDSKVPEKKDDKKGGK